MRWLLILLGLWIAAPARADCYDRRVTATIVAQVPAPIPDPGDDTIVMHWPWFVDLAVERVGGGTDRLSVQTMQHSYLARGLRGRWLLRRNTAGGYNAWWRGGEGHARRCPAGTPPARPHLDTETPAALTALRRDGEARYGIRR